MKETLFDVIKFGFLIGALIVLIMCLQVFSPPKRNWYERFTENEFDEFNGQRS